MNLPTDEHSETRARELNNALSALMPKDGSVGIGIVVTTGKLLPCKCCYSTEGACALRPGASSDPETEAQMFCSATVGVLYRLGLALSEIIEPKNVPNALISSLTSAIELLEAHK